MIDNVYLNTTSLQDLGFYLKWRELSAPAPKTSYEDIPGAHGAVDTTDELFYEMRELKLDCIHPNADFQSDYDQILSMFHGKQCRIVFASDPDYYWTGRVTVGGYSKKNHSLTMSATVYPFKFKNEETVVTATDETVTLENGRMPVTPTVTNDAEATLTFGTSTVTLSAGTHIVAGLELSENSETEVTVAGTATFTYREGTL